MGSFNGPDGASRRYFILEGPGLPPAPATLPPYEQARGLPGCVVLPWGPEGNLDRDREAIPLWPYGVDGGLAPSALGPLKGPSSGRLWLMSLDSYRYVNRWDVPVLQVPGTIEIPGGNYSYAVWLKRARTDGNADGAVSSGPSLLQPDDPPADAFSDTLLEVRILIYRGFDPQEFVGKELMEPVSDTVVPLSQFVSLLRVP